MNNFYNQKEKEVTPIASDADTARRLAKKHLHGAFGSLANNPLDSSVIRGKTRESITVGDVISIMKKGGRIPCKDRDKVDLLLNNQTLIPKNSGIKDVKNLFDSLSLEVVFSDHFLDIFRTVLLNLPLSPTMKFPYRL